MEFYGIGFREETFRNHYDLITRKLKNLEARAYRLAGREFELTCPADISVVLFQELQIPFPHSPAKYFIFSSLL